MAKKIHEGGPHAAINLSRRQWLARLAAVPFVPWVTAGWAQAAIPTRVYGANPSVTYLLAALAPETFLGWNFPPPSQSRGYFSDTVFTKPVIGGFFGQGKSPNVEALLATRPELAIVSDELKIPQREAFQHIDAWGIRHVELRGLTGGRIPDGDVDEAQRLAESYGMTITSLSPGVFKCPAQSSAIDEHLIRLDKTLDQ